jgi:hypothetical protein
MDEKRSSAERVSTKVETLGDSLKNTSSGKCPRDYID